jgi:tRNA threonylcarbamoyladenosine biosynthesis protein TsaE
MVNESECMDTGVFSSDAAGTTGEIARRLGALCRGGEVVLLLGDLGAGKTRFARGLAEGLGVGKDTPVTSPTFILHAEYSGRLVFNHLDLYRLDDEGDLDGVGVLDMVYDPAAVAAIEWPELLRRHVGGESLAVTLEHDGERRRRIVVQAAGARHRRLADAWFESAVKFVER